jgi:hypothetical protein
MTIIPLPKATGLLADGALRPGDLVERLTVYLGNGLCQAGPT